MNLQNQFKDGFALYIRTVKPSIKNDVITGNDKKKVKPFYLTPERVGNVSTIKILTEQFGILNGVRKTFDTGFISSKVITQYNNSQLFLVLNNDVVDLKIISGNQFHNGFYWNIEKIVLRMKKKNPELVNIINDVYVKNLINEGKLRVKFNVKKKNHGTLWKVMT